MQQPATLVDLLQMRATQQPDNMAYCFLLDGESREATITYGALHQRAQSIAAVLQAQYTPGERLLLLYPPGLDYITSFFACMYAGLVPVPVYTPDSRNISRLQNILDDARAAGALSTEKVMQNFMAMSSKDASYSRNQLKDTDWLATDALGADHAGIYRRPGISQHSIAFLQYTSGSTSKPKGVILTHQNLLFNSKLIFKYFNHSSEHYGVSWLPPYHDMGLIGGILQPLYGGFPVSLMSPLSFIKKPLRWLQCLSNNNNKGILSTAAPNFAFELCNRQVTDEQAALLNLGNLKTAATGAEPVRSSTLTDFVNKFAASGFRKEAFLPVYGLAEATLLASAGNTGDLPVIRYFNKTALAENRLQEEPTAGTGTVELAGCGKSPQEQVIIIADPASGDRLNDKMIGEIWIHGESVGSGYWDNPEETARVFEAACAEMPGKPFLRTGDLGFLQDGELFITGRLKDLIIIRGRNHYPQDIEHTVSSAHPALRTGGCAAFSIEEDEEEKLVVVQEVERKFEGETGKEDVFLLISEAVFLHHALRVSKILLIEASSIPKTSSGKIMRHAARKQFLEGSLKLVAAYHPEETGEITR